MSDKLKLAVHGQLEPVYVMGDLTGFMNDLNVAAAAGKQYVIAQEAGAGPICIETRSITLVREVGDEEEAFIGGGA